jgi:hypothetical protein
VTNSPRTLANILVILALVFAASGMSFAKGNKGGKPNGSPAPTAAHHTTILMISPNSITVREPKGTKDFVITQFTSFTFKGTPVRVEALKSGMRVAIGTGTDPRVAERIDADDPPADGKK